MKINSHYSNHLFSIILFFASCTFVLGVEKTKVEIPDQTISAIRAESKQVLDLENIQQLRLLKQQDQNMKAKPGEAGAKFKPVFNKQERGGWLPGKTPSFLKKRPSANIILSNQNSRDAIQILFNNSTDTTYTLGDTLTLTVIFSDGEDSASIGGYLDNGDGVFNDTTDIWLFDVGDMWIFDNDPEDENPAVGIFEISFFIDPTVTANDAMPFFLEGASTYFTATDGGGTATAHLDILGIASTYSISGVITPATANFLIIAIPTWGMGMDHNDRPIEIWAAVTDTNGTYSIHVKEPGLYSIMAVDVFGVTHPQLFPEEFMQWVDVVDAVTDININLVEANAWIAGNVLDQDAAPVSDIPVWADNGPFSVEAVTDADGSYYLGVMAWNNPFGDSWWETIWNLNVDEAALWPDYMIPQGRGVLVNFGDYIDNPELTHFTLFANDATIIGSIEFPADLDMNCFGIFTWHFEMQVFNWVDFCDTVYTSPVSYSLPVSSALDDYGEYWVGVWADVAQNELISIPDGYQVSSGETGVDFEMVIPNAWLEGQVFSSVDNFPIQHAWVNIHNDSIAIGRGTGPDGFFEIPAIGDMWYHLEVQAEGFEPFFEDSVFISADESLWVDVALDYGGGNFGEPHLYAVNDVPHDQGYKVRLQWTSGEPGGWGYFTGYSIWRHVPGTGMDEPLWDFIRMVPWHGFGDYSTIVPTLGNATPFDTTWSVFIVTAHTDDPNFFLDSNPMRGFSVDNLHPSPPLGFQASTDIGNVEVELSWRPVPAPDLDYFTVYRGLESGFEPEEPYDFTIDTAFVDAAVALGETYYYLVTATDFNGNESIYSNEATAAMLGTVNDAFIPDRFGLAQNYPNPFNPVTTITYDLPQDSRVTLTVYDILGNEISVLVNDNLPAGRYSQKFNASDLTSGIYFFRIDAHQQTGGQAGKFQQTRKMMILK